nr:MAG TPA: restriction alleviation protein [Caudoviricetes sp.]
MRKRELLLINPCPKCGGEPERVATWYADGKNGYTKEVVRCTVCGKNVARTTGQEAVKAWNKLK